MRTADSRDELPVASFDSPSVEEPMRLAVVADPHLCEDEAAYDKVYRPTTVFERTVDDINARGVDATVSLGDLTLTGREAEFDLVDDAIADLESPFVSIPGNHDVPNAFNSHPGLSVERFAERYAPDQFPFSIEVGGRELLGLDSASAEAVEHSHDGFVDDSQIDWLDDRLASADEPIVLIHHNLPDAIDQYDEYKQVVDPSLGTPPVLRDPEPLVDVLAAHEVPLVLSGHLHVPMFAVTEGIRELLVPTTSTFPQSYYLVDVDASGTHVSYVSVAGVSEAALAYEGRSSRKRKARVLCEIASHRLSSFPLHEDSGPGPD